LFFFLFLFGVRLLIPVTLAQDSESDAIELARIRGKSSPGVLRAFTSVVAQARLSMVRFDKDGKEIALGVIVDAEGLALSKASELDASKLTCRLATGRVVDAQVVATDPDTDLALIRISASGLKPVQWSRQPAVVGEWVVTPGIDPVPEAVGILSVPARRIPPKRVLLGVQLDFRQPTARISSILPGMGAEKAGLKSGDVIVAVNGGAITNREQLFAVVGKFREGQVVDVRFRRESDEMQAQIELRSLKEAPFERGRNRQDRMNHFGSELSRRAEGFQTALQHDTVLQSWQCGGPLLNVEGKAIGLNIARAGRVASYALPSDLIQETLSNLKQQLQKPVSQPDDEVPLPEEEVPHL
jgi:serine protease Do